MSFEVKTFEALCHRTAAKLREITRTLDTGKAELSAYAPAVIEAIDGHCGVFWALDEKPGRYGGYDTPDGYAGTLRRVRNSPEWGPKLFSTFKEGS